MECISHVIEQPSTLSEGRNSKDLSVSSNNYILNVSTATQCSMSSDWAAAGGLSGFVGGDIIRNIVGMMKSSRCSSGLNNTFSCFSDSSLIFREV